MTRGRRGLGTRFEPPRERSGSFVDGGPVSWATPSALVDHSAWRRPYHRSREPGRDRAGSEWGPPWKPARVATSSGTPWCIRRGVADALGQRAPESDRGQTFSRGKMSADSQGERCGYRSWRPALAGLADGVRAVVPVRTATRTSPCITSAVARASRLPRCRAVPVASSSQPSAGTARSEVDRDVDRREAGAAAGGGLCTAAAAADFASGVFRRAWSAL